MNNPVKVRIRDRVALVTLALPPANALTPEVRRALVGTMDCVAGDPGVGAAVLLAEGQIFSSGPDIREGGSGGDGPTLAEVCARIEAMPVPVVAALQGLALGGGAELALAAHYRLAAPEVRLGFPEITLGLVPGAGATQRLPRAVGAGTALGLLLSGRPVDAETARKSGLLDGVVTGHLATGAHSYATALIAEGQGPRPLSGDRSRLVDGEGFLAAVARARTAAEGTPGPAAARIVDSVEAALLLPFEAGLAFEAAARAQCRESPEAVALAHLFLAERRISPRLLASAGHRREVAAPAGQAVVDRLRQALDAALQALRAEGSPPERIVHALGLLGVGEAVPSASVAPETAALARRLTAALMVEGARIVEAREVERAADIDVLAIYGLGLARSSGGPMRAAQTMGLLALKQEMEVWAATRPELWTPPRLMLQAIKFAGGFDEVTVRPAATADAVPETTNAGP
ncbi:enoyl-CoA hydratase/isomerase family protein [Histidinibacterium lentulum]|uniref:enoyl-CoA hydratase/isomerase family protein n=1 Tax=Histidinibacterium lentulum TaxID=2480588 RepID=UPI0016170C8F|nr:enoyl-CoA hydratase/isomerase family protein [Histidinibacterium lentulum]